VGVIDGDHDAGKTAGDREQRYRAWQSKFGALESLMSLSIQIKAMMIKRERLFYLGRWNTKETHIA
jgi:hypothetical protein